jgi:hypothetical protein
MGLDERLLAVTTNQFSPFHVQQENKNYAGSENHSPH